MERLIDDCIIMDYGSILIQEPVDKLLNTLRCYTAKIAEGYELPVLNGFYHPSVLKNKFEAFSFMAQEEVENKLKALNIPYVELKGERVSLEDAFIGLTGKY